jgi:hypothetical protein
VGCVRGASVPFRRRGFVEGGADGNTPKKGRERLESSDGRRSLPQKEIALLPTRSSSATLNPEESPKRLRGTATFACTRAGCLFCIPKRVPAVAHPRSARTNFRQSLMSEDMVPVGFCSGGFTSTSSLRSGQRGPTEVERRSLPRWLIIPSERRRVFIRAAREIPVSFLPAQAFRLRPGRQWQQLLPPVAVLKRRVTASPADPLAGHGSLENRDGSRTIRTRVWAVKTFFRKSFSSLFARFSGFSHHSHSSSTGVFHRWKIHLRFVENSCARPPLRK